MREALARLEAHATKKTLEGMARCGIPQTGALGVMIRDIQALAKSLGQSHGGTTLSSAAALARVLGVRLAALLEDPPRAGRKSGVSDHVELPWRSESAAHRRLFAKLIQWPEERVASLERAIVAWETAPPKPRGRTKRRPS